MFNDTPSALFPYRLAAIDIDDTLIGPDKTASAFNLERVRRLQSRGVRVILATGRSFRNMLPFCTALGLSDYMVDTFGAVVRHSARDAILLRKTLPPADAAAMIDEGRRRGFTVLAFVPEGVLAERPSPWIEACRGAGGSDEPLHWTLLSDTARADVERVVWLAEPGALAPLAQAFPAQFQDRLTVIHTLPFALEFFAPGVDKASGVEAVARHYGIAPAEVVAFGDGHQDLPMLSWAGLGIAMAHGAAARSGVRVAPAGDPATALARAIDELMERV